MAARTPFSFAYLTQSYQGNPALAPGVTVTPGFSNADGTPVAVIGTALTHDVELLQVLIHAATANSQAGVDTSAILDILIDRAGGTSWDSVPLIEGLFCGFMAAQPSTGLLNTRRWEFPLWIPAGATLAARGRSKAPSGAVAVEVALIARGGPSDPNRWWCGQKADAIGIDRASSGGTALAPSATGNAYGSWTSIGSPTARRYGALLPSVCPLSAAIAGGNRQMQIGVGSGAQQFGPTFGYIESTNEVCTDLMESKTVYRDTPENTQLQARNRAATSSATGDQVIIHGVG